MSIYSLIVDDREDFTNQFKAEAKHHGINVAAKTNLKDMIEFLPKNADKLSAIILDIKCLKDRDQELEHENFLPAAIMYLDKEYPYIPRIILTADSVSYEEVRRYHPDEMLFRKTTEQISKVLKIIQEKSKELPKLKLIQQYSDVFVVFRKGYLDHEYEKDLLDLLQNINSNDTTQIKNSLVTVRRVQEKVLQELNKRNKAVVPDSCISINGNVNFRAADKHLKGNKDYKSSYKPTTTDYYSGVIEDLCPMMYNIASATSAHNSYAGLEFPPSKYTVQSCTFALLDYLKWFEERMDKSPISS